jgi:hypothetical protein
MAMDQALYDMIPFVRIRNIRQVDHAVSGGICLH